MHAHLIPITLHNPVTRLSLPFHPYNNNTNQHVGCISPPPPASPYQLYFRPASPPCPAAIYAVRLQQTTSWSSKAKPDHQEREGNMAQENPAPKKTTSVDPMSNSFGEGYATRSDEEGFGGIYGGNQSLRLEECNKGNVVHGKNHSDDNDKTQGSEVKEKERGRNLPNGCHVG